MHRLWLIGLREFKAYVATLSFWVALAVGPVMMLVAAGLLAASSEPPAPLRIVVVAPDAAIRADAAAAVADAAELAGRPVVIDYNQGQARVRIEPRGESLIAHFEGASLPQPAQRLFKAEFEKRLALRRLGASGGAPSPAVELPPPPPPKAAAPDAGARFGLVFMLWLTLTGSLGMLLQAVVRERANRALDSLLAAAQPVEIVFGKLLGVGAVSLLVLAAWVGTAAGLGGLMPPALQGGGGAISGAIAAFAEPVLLVQAAGVYVLTYVMYGSITIALGARAQDVASAQNLSRPMFGVLLIAFFAALASAMGAAAALDWMIWIPPLTPFMLLLTPGAQMPTATALAALGVTALGAMFAGWLAAQSLTGRKVRAPILAPQS